MRMNPNNTPTAAEALGLFQGALTEPIPAVFIKEKRKTVKKECSVPWRDYKCSRET